MRISRLIGLTTFVLLCVIGVSAAYAQTGAVSDDFYPLWSPAGDKILFVSTRTGNYDLFTMNPDGTEVTRLTDDPAWDSNPAWSPDGTQIAFSSARTGGGDIYIMDADGSNLRQLTDFEGYESMPQWSPDGSRILFSRRVDHPNLMIDFTMVTIDIETGEERDFGSLIWSPSSESYSTSGVWSPDGSEIIMQHYFQYRANSGCINDGNLYRVNVEDVTIRDVIHFDGGGYFYTVTWADDDVLTVYKSIDEQCFTQLASGWYEVNLETREMRERHYGSVYHDFAHSPNGELVAYLAYNGMNNQVMITDPSLFSLKVVLESQMQSNPFGISWSPDSQSIVVSVCTDSDADIFVIDAETGNVVNLTETAEVLEAATFTECGMLG